MNMVSLQKPHCPVCRSDATFEFLHRPDVPVHQNLLLASPEAARGLARGDLALRLCADCGFAFNAAFRCDLLDYGQDYDNTQNWSPAFDSYTDDLVRELVLTDGVRDCRVVEVGCGKGAFLRKLVAYSGAGNTGHGFDPTYVGPDEDLEGRLRFTRRFFGEDASVAADVIVSRHVIEHVEEPLNLLRSARAGLAPAGRAFIETPCLEWILRNRVVWDFFYEHCSLFTAGSLTAAAARVGFGGLQVCSVFGGQYLWLRAGVQGPAVPASAPTPELIRRARAYAREEQEQVRAWQTLVHRRAASGAVAVWGAGAKGVTFCNLVDPACRLLTCVLDVNPAKQGKFIAGTGHRILAPEAMHPSNVAAILVLNPNYTGEISAQVAQLGSKAEVVDAMRAVQPIAGFRQAG